MKKGIKFLATLLVLLCACGKETTSLPIVSTASPAPFRSASISEPQKTSQSEPYIGMYVPSPPENWVWQGTDYSSVKDKSGKSVVTTKYRYDTSTKIYTIYVNAAGSVVKLSEITRRDSTGSKPKGYSQSVPDATDFVHPEDYYEWYFDDFIDYEDAEEAYYRAGGK